MYQSEFWWLTAANTKQGVCVCTWMHACGLMFPCKGKECSQWNCYWLWPVDLLSWLCTSLIQPQNLWLFMTAWDNMNGVCVDANCSVFYWRKHSKKGTCNHYKWTPLLHQLTVITPVGWYNENSFCLGVWLQRGEETRRLKRTRLAEVDCSKCD